MIKVKVNISNPSRSNYVSQMVYINSNEVLQRFPHFWTLEKNEQKYIIYQLASEKITARSSYEIVLRPEQK